MKKKICIMLAALMLSCTALTACGGSDSSGSSSKASGTSDSASDNNGPEQPAENVEKDVAAIADKLKSDITYVDALNELDLAMVEKLIKIKPDLYTTAKIYIGSGGFTAEEIECFEAKDEASADEIYTSLENRIEAQKKAFENYQPAEMDKLNDPVLVKQGKYVFMCLSDDNAKAKEIIGA